MRDLSLRSELPVVSTSPDWSDGQRASGVSVLGTT